MIRPSSIAVLTTCLLAVTPAAAQLNSEGNLFLTLASPGVPGAPSEDDTFARALAVGDFDHDGYDDLAIGIPGDIFAGPAPDINGRVVVLYGVAAGGFDLFRGQELGQDPCNGQAKCLKLAGNPEANKAFGFSLAAGDFDGDTYDDLAIGAPWADSIAGEVIVAHGSAAGLTAQQSQLWNQDNNDLTGQAEAGDIFGYALTANDFNGDGADDLAISIPGENLNVEGANVPDAGAAIVLYGAIGRGLTTVNHQFWSQSNNVTGDAEVVAILGAAMTSADFDGDGYDDLAISAPFAMVGGVNQAGAVHEIPGSKLGLVAAGQQVWERGGPDVSHQLGTTLSTGDFNNDGFDDVVFGMPFADAGAVMDAGRMDILFGTQQGLTGFGFQKLVKSEEPLASFSSGPKADDLIGYGVTGGDFNGDGFDDLVYSIPGQMAGGAANAGAFRSLFGTALPSPAAPVGGLTARGTQFFVQGAKGIADEAEAGDQVGLPWPNRPSPPASRFGNPATSGDFNGDGFDDLALGVPLEDLVDPDTGAIPNAGGVHVLFGGRQPPTGQQQQINDLRSVIQDLENLLP
ncbi:MAG: hypothetical protein GY953_20000 [bacterium]|nr:hypothetical protein [bacterium]